MIFIFSFWFLGEGQELLEVPCVPSWDAPVNDFNGFRLVPLHQNLEKYQYYTTGPDGIGGRALIETPPRTSPYHLLIPPSCPQAPPHREKLFKITIPSPPPSAAPTIVPGPPRDP